MSTHYKLLEICHPKQWPTIAGSEMSGNGYPVYGANGIIGRHDAFTHEKPTLMITCRGATCGSLNISEGRCYINGNAMALDDLDEKKMHLPFLYYFLQKRGFQDVISGSAQPQITRQGLAKILIPKMPLEEQKRIAAILDKADSLRRKRAQAIALADDFLRATFLEMFGDPVTNPKGWPVYELKDLVEIGDKINYGVVQPGGDAFDDGVPLVRSGDLSDETPDVATLRFVSQAIDQKHRKSKLKGNEVLIACVGTVGKVGFVTEEMIGWNIARAVARIPIKSGVNREYIYRYLQSPVVQGFFQKETRIVAQPTLNVGLIETTPIALPPERLQLEYLEKYTKVQRFLSLLKKQIEELEKLAKSLSISLVIN